MANWTSGYVHQIPYTQGFYRELGPSMMRLCTRLGGFEPTSSSEFAYCELGFGQGVSSNIHAAAYPKSQFYGTDFLPEHAVYAQRIADRANLENVHWFDDGFEEFLQRPLPDFDYIVLHGIYSWVEPKVREQIRQFLKKRLKPGGLVYLSYNCLPGWSAAAPLRNLLAQYAFEHTASALPLIERFNQALEFVENLSATGTRYFDSVPELKERLRLLKDNDPRYLVHEYLNKTWSPYYSADLATELAEAKVSFAASGLIFDHFDAMCLNPEMAGLIGKLPDSRFRQTVKDYMLNTPFRRDLFSRGALQLLPKERNQLLIDTPFALSVGRDRIEKYFDAPIGRVTIKESLASAIADRLSEGPASAREISKVLGGEDGKPGTVMQMMAAYVGAGWAMPCEEPNESDVLVAHRANAAFAQMAMEGADWRYLVSPLTGSALSVSRTQLLFLAAHLADKITVTDRAEFVAAALLAQGQRILHKGRPAENSMEVQAEVIPQSETFERQLLPLLRMHAAIK